MKQIDVVGMGPGNPELLSAQAHRIIQGAKRVLNTREMAISDLLKKLEEPIEGSTAVLVSGDTGFHSLAQTIEKQFKKDALVSFYPGVSSIAYLSSRLKVPYDDAKLISLHGNQKSLVPYVSYHHKVFALTGGVNRASDCCEALTKAGLGEVEVVIGEALTLPHERILKGQAKDFIDAELLDLAVLYVEHSNWISPNKNLKDSDFIRGKVPMTKEEIRHLSIDKLQVEPDEVVYDIGAGTGSVAIELARKAYQGMVYAIERKEGGLELIQENRLKHGAFNLNVIKGLAPAALEGLPAPDKVFIGGSGGQMAEIVEKLLVVNPKLKLVINVVSLQGINEAIKILDGYQTMDYEVICVNVARSRKLGSYDLMMAQNPVYIITMDFAKMKGESEDE